ncbi:MAG TPA: T9SS type A sorting domain-containing protein [Chitinophagales bacterium]|nr:T9SS type A sorting domain-containing protein [Chitinophagales bacterium]
MKSTILLSLLLYFSLNDNAIAQWSIDVDKDDSVCTANGWQEYPHLISDGKGGAYISWVDYRADKQIYAQWVDKNGTKRWMNDGINISLGQSLDSWDDYSMIDDSAGGFLIVYGRESLHFHYLERVDSNGSILWNIDFGQFYHLHNFDAIADGKGGAYFLYSSSEDSIYFLHLNQYGFNVTSNGKKFITRTLGNAGRIMIRDSVSLLIAAESWPAGKTLICITDTGSNILSSVTTMADEKVEFLQRGFNHDAYLVTTDSYWNGYFDYSSSIRFFRIVDTNALSVSLLGLDNTFGLTSARLYQFVPSDSDHLYFGYSKLDEGNLAKVRKDGSDFKILKLNPGIWSMCSDGVGGFYSNPGGQNYIYHYRSTDSTSFSDTILFTSLVSNCTVSGIITDNEKGCLIAFARNPFDYNIDYNIYSKHYPSSGMIEGIHNELKISPLTISIFPNPTSATSLITYTLSTPASVTIDLYDVLGNKLQQIVNGNQKQGEHNATLDARKLVSGVYVLQVRAGEQMAEQKVVMMK